MSKREVQNTAIQLMLIFLVIYLVFNFTATLFYFIQGYEAYGPPADDSFYYHNQAVLIAQTRDFSHAKLPYEYLIGIIYFIFGVSIGPYAFKVFISLIASFNMYLLISILGSICINKGIDKKTFNKWAKIFSLFILFYPTYNFYSLNLCRDLLIVNGVLMFVSTFMNIFIYKSKNKNHYFLLLFSFLDVFILRPYFGALIVGTILLYLFSEKRIFNIRNIIALSLFVITTGIFLKFTKYGLFGINYWSSLANIQSLENYRKSSSAGNLILNIDINFRNPIQFLLTYSQAFIVNHIYPLPYYINGISNILFIPENFIVTSMLVFVLKNIKTKIKQFKELKFLLIYYILNVGFIVSFSDNIGTNIRLRMSFVICLLIMFFISKEFEKVSSNANYFKGIGDVKFESVTHNQ